MERMQSYRWFLLYAVVACTIGICSGTNPLFKFLYRKSHNLKVSALSTLNETTSENVNSLVANDFLVKSFANLNTSSPQYAGFIPIPEGNIFYWLVTAEVVKPDTPIVIWLNGGPGCSSMIGMLQENGPFRFQGNTVRENKYGWHKAAHILYVDQPLGTGFSFATGDLPTTHAQSASHFYSFLNGFFKRHTDYLHTDRMITNPVYIFGESYAGQWIPFITNEILDRNAIIYRSRISPYINIQGIGIGNGWMHPLIQQDYSDYAHGMGMLTYGQLQTLKKSQNECLQSSNSLQALNQSICIDNMMAILDSINTDNGETSVYDIRVFGDVDDYPAGTHNLSEFLNLNSTRSSIHATSTHKFEDCNNAVFDAFTAERASSSLHVIENILSNGIRVLMYNGQWDLICNHIGVEQVLLNLKWPGAASYQKASRNKWTVSGQVKPAGYAQEGGNLTYIVVTDAGHMVPYDKPEASLDMLQRFISGSSFADMPQSVYTTPVDGTSYNGKSCNSQPQAPMASVKASAMRLGLQSIIPSTLLAAILFIV